MNSPVKIRRFFWGDLVFPLVFLLSLAGAIGAVLTPQDPPVPFVGWAILWSVPVCLLIINILLVVRRMSVGSALKYEYRGVVVAWEDSKWAVDRDRFEVALDAYIEKMRDAYPNVQYSLLGCVVFFREPKWAIDSRPGTVARYVAGLQDNTLLYVGWNERLSRTALEHELTHRVFQVFEGDPPQNIAHAMMQSMGIS